MVLMDDLEDPRAVVDGVALPTTTTIISKCLMSTLSAIKLTSPVATITTIINQKRSRLPSATLTAHYP
jgi:hypothetical protein